MMVERRRWQGKAATGGSGGGSAAAGHRVGFLGRKGFWRGEQWRRDSERWESRGGGFVGGRGQAYFTVDGLLREKSEEDDEEEGDEGVCFS